MLEYAVFYLIQKGFRLSAGLYTANKYNSCQVSQSK